MKNRTAPQTQATTKPVNPRRLKPESHFDRLREVQEAIACRAYELFESRGCEHGQDRTDWLRAESEILQPLPLQVSEYEDRLAVEATLPGFRVEEVEYSIEPRRLIITGRTGRDNEDEKNSSSKETLTKATFHVLDLPVEVEADQVEATFGDGVLTVTVPKINVGKTSQAQASSV